MNLLDFLMPRKIRELIQDLKAAGWRQVSGGKGSHRKFKHDKFPGSVMIPGHETTTQNPTLKSKSGMQPKGKPMSESERITMWIGWSDEDASFIGYCPQFFPYGAVCHDPTDAKAVAKLATIVRDELEEQTRRRIRRTSVPR